MNKFSFVSLLLVSTLVISSFAHAMSDEKELIGTPTSPRSSVDKVYESFQIGTKTPHKVLRIQELELAELIGNDIFNNLSVHDLVQNARLVSREFLAHVHAHLSKRKETELSDLIKLPQPQINFENNLFVFPYKSFISFDFYPFSSKFHTPPGVSDLSDSEKRIVQSTKIHHALIQHKKKLDYEEKYFLILNYKPLNLELLKFEPPKFEFLIFYDSERK